MQYVLYAQTMTGEGMAIDFEDIRILKNFSDGLTFIRSKKDQSFVVITDSIDWGVDYEGEDPRNVS